DDAVSDGLAGGGPERVAERLELPAVPGGGALTIRSAQPLQDVLAGGLAEHEPVVALLRDVGAGTARGDERDRQRQACRETYRHGHPPNSKRRATGRHCVSWAYAIERENPAGFLRGRAAGRAGASGSAPVAVAPGAGVLVELAAQMQALEHELERRRSAGGVPRPELLEGRLECPHL